MWIKDIIQKEYWHMDNEWKVKKFRRNNEELLPKIITKEIQEHFLRKKYGVHND